MVTFVCENCGAISSKWRAKCLTCENYDTIKEARSAAGIENKAGKAGLKTGDAIKPSRPAKTLVDVATKNIKRIKTGVSEFDRVLGGGLVPGEVVLLAGAPGAGKSTLCMRLASNLAETGATVLYSSGEESEEQVGLRAKRMGVKSRNVLVVNETNLESLLGQIGETKPHILIIDSLQTIASSEINGSIGSVTQSKEAAHLLTRVAKTSNIIMILVNQIVKSGEFAGSEAAIHIVDCALMLDNDPDTPLKFLRCTKNRFGDANEVGIFAHTEQGLQEVADPTFALSGDETRARSGATHTLIAEGVRQILVETQALVSPSPLPTPRKQFSGIQPVRGQIICAILDKYCGTSLAESDVFVSTVAGIKTSDVCADLAVAAAILQSATGKTSTVKTAYIGEIGLTGEIRKNFTVNQKIREAKRMGFERIVTPEHGINELPYGENVIEISDIKELKRVI